MKKAPETSEELLAKLGELFDQVPPETPEEVHAELQAAGLDPDGVGARMQAIAERALTSSPWNWRSRAAGERRAALARHQRARSNRLRDLLRLPKQQLLELARRRLDLSGAQASFRNYEDASAEDLARLVADLDYLDDVGESGED